LSVADRNDDTVAKKKELFSNTLRDRLKERVKAMKDPNAKDPLVQEVEELEAQRRQWAEEATPDHVGYQQWDPSELGYIGDPADDKQPLPELAEADDLEMGYDAYVTAKVMLPAEGHTFKAGTVKRRARDEGGVLIGRSNPNPLLDTSVYEVEFEDGSADCYHANIIAENIYARLDADGHSEFLLDEIIDHKKDETALSDGNAFVYDKRHNKVPKKTTQGWKLLVQFKDQSTSWVKLKDLKESHPVQLAEYAKNNQLMDEPAFRWWAPHIIRKRDRILKKMNSRYHRTTQKFGIEVPKTIARALEIDKETGTTFWKDAIEKEMNTVKVAFELLAEGADEPKGRQFIPCHMHFDIKNFTLVRKARYVVQGNKVDTTDVPTYASVVSRESVRIAFTLAALNGLSVLSANCLRAHLNAVPRERLHTKCGPEWGEMEGRWAIVVRAIYKVSVQQHHGDQPFLVQLRSWDTSHAGLTQMFG